MSRPRLYSGIDTVYSQAKMKLILMKFPVEVKDKIKLVPIKTIEEAVSLTLLLKGKKAKA